MVLHFPVRSGGGAPFSGGGIDYWWWWWSVLIPQNRKITKIIFSN